MTIKPNSYLPPTSQQWGRWVDDSISLINGEINTLNLAAQNNARKVDIAIPQPMRGLLTRQTSFTVTITAAGTYVPINTAGTLDTDVSFNMVASGSPNVTGLKNDTDQTRILGIIATYDGKGGNNNGIGLKLGLNGVQIDESECRSFGGASGQVGKTLTQFIIRLEPGDEVSMYAANIDAVTNLTIDRFKMMAYAIP